MPLAAGTKLGPYEILGQIGAGGMGEVYKARDTRLTRLVAIKVLPAGRMTDVERRQRFIQEARSASALNHPCIITIHDIAVDHERDYLVMEYVAGKTLHALIPRTGMELRELLKIAIQLSDRTAATGPLGGTSREPQAVCSAYQAAEVLGIVGQVIEIGRVQIKRLPRRSIPELATREHAS